MNTEMVQLVAWGLAGLAATLVMDIAGGLIRRTGLTHGAPHGLVGRFFQSVFRGHFTELDSSIASGSSPSVGFIVLIHYAIGAALGVLFGLGTLLWGSTPSWWLAVLYGIGTTVLPALWMFPAMGFGLFGLRGPSEYRLLPTALVNHLFFGIGLALAAGLVVPLFR